MTSVSKRIVAHARSVPEAAPICAGALVHLGSRTAVDQALRMAEPVSHLVATPHQEPQS